MADEIIRLDYSAEDIGDNIDEVRTARGTYESLDERLDEIEGGGFTPTQAQLDAMNSTATQAKIDQIQTNKNNILLEQQKTTGMETGGSNYIQVNGIRLYISDIVPTGNIPIGSIGMGWEMATYMYKTATEIITSPIYADGTAITSYTIKGNTDNPVNINGVGVRSENLVYSIINGANIASNGTIDELEGYDVAIAPVESGIVYTASTFVFAFYTSEPTVGSVSYDNSRVTTTPGRASTFTAPITGYVAFRVNAGDTAMINLGSTALPYVPYGYKIPISNAQQTIDIYIGDLPLLKSLDGTAVDEINNGTLTRRVDADGSVLPTPVITQITMPSIPTTDGANSIIVDTTVQPSEFTATWTGWHNATVKE
jgi:hypothetical protein